MSHVVAMRISRLLASLVAATAVSAASLKQVTYPNNATSKVQM